MITIENGEETLPSSITDFILREGASLGFAKAFWKECEPHPYELKRYALYASVMRLHAEGKKLSQIVASTGVLRHSVIRWIKLEQRPKLAHFLGLYLGLGNPRPGWTWLSVNNSSGHAVPLGPILQVPSSISKWQDIEDVLSQIQSPDTGDGGMSREYLFGFLLGMVIGDAAKSRERSWHRHIGLVMSKKYSTNERIGEFTCRCARSIGLRMHRVSDQPKLPSKPYGFFEWTSQASPLVDWIFNVCLGLRDGEKTTYDAVRMDWVLESPMDFRRGLVQGVAESDGSVSIASQTVEFWIGPNWDFFKGLLLTFDVKSFRNREALSVTKTQVQKLNSIPPFVPHLATPRYQRFQKLANATHIGHGKRIPPEIRDFILRNCMEGSVPQISESVVDKFGVVLNFEAVQRWVRKGQKQAQIRINEPQQAATQ